MESLQTGKKLAQAVGDEFNGYCGQQESHETRYDVNAGFPQHFNGRHSHTQYNPYGQCDY